MSGKPWDIDRCCLRQSSWVWLGLKLCRWKIWSIFNGFRRIEHWKKVSKMHNPFFFWTSVSVYFVFASITRIDVWMINWRYEFRTWWPKWIMWIEFHRNFKLKFFIWSFFWTRNHSFQRFIWIVLNITMDSFFEIKNVQNIYLVEFIFFSHTFQTLFVQHEFVKNLIYHDHSMTLQFVWFRLVDASAECQLKMDYTCCCCCFLCFK